MNLQGKGDKVAKFTIPADAPAIAKISYSGTSNFVVESLAVDGSTNDLLVNVIGKYKGTVLFDTDIETYSVAFRVTASGSWTIAIQPLTSARSWNGTTKLTGTGDDVVVLNPASIGLTTVKITHSGSSNFVVIGFSDSASDLLVNEIGHYSGEQLLTEGTLLLQIEADGAWTVVKT